MGIIPAAMAVEKAVLDRSPLGSTRRCMQGAFRRLFPALEAFVCPHVAPLSVTPTVGYSQLIKVAVYGFERGRAIEVENDVGISELHRLLAQDLIVFPEEATTTEIPDDRFNQVLG